MGYMLLMFLVLSLAIPGCDSGHETVTVVTPVSIGTPTNLLQTQECKDLWGNVQRFGLGMDKASKEWNEVVIESAMLLIEKGCVERRGKP